jgi:hypothetical protein
MKLLFKIVSIFLLLLAVSISGMAQSYYKKKVHPASTRNYDEIAPVLMGDTIMVYCSNRPISGPKSTTDMQSRSFFKIVESEKTEGGKWKSQKMFDPGLSSNFHDGPVSFNEKGDYMVFSRCFNQKTSNRAVSRFGLYFADYQNGSWGNIQEFEFNDRSANTIEPSFNKDASVLYFASDREGGFGGFDLYSCKYVNGRWAAPENLGPRVNTTENELFPFIHTSGRIYFSSEGHDNKKDGYDLFYSEYYNGKWIDPIKLPPPFNSKKNDYTFSVDSLFQDGFYTSDIRGSKDIYTFRSTIPIFKKTPTEQKIDKFCYLFFEENTVELDTNLYMYEWNLGDKSKIRALKAKHCYAKPGNYTVSLNVVDKLTKEVLFSQAEYEVNVEKIVQAFITCPDKIKVNEDNQFSGLESYLKDAKPGEYYWDFGDGTKGIGASIRHKYLRPGTYEVTLGVIEDVPNAKLVPQEFLSYKTIVVTEN